MVFCAILLKKCGGKTRNDVICEGGVIFEVGVVIRVARRGEVWQGNAGSTVQAMVGEILEGTRRGSTGVTLRRRVKNIFGRTRRRGRGRSTKNIGRRNGSRRRRRAVGVCRRATVFVRVGASI